MQKLLNLARRIAPTIKFASSASSIYYHLRGDDFLKPVYDALDAKEIIYLSFLIQGYKEGRDLQDVIQRCQEGLFSFSILNVSREHPEESCDECYGDGSVNCSTCDVLIVMVTVKTMKGTIVPTAMVVEKLNVIIVMGINMKLVTVVVAQAHKIVTVNMRLSKVTMFQ